MLYATGKSGTIGRHLSNDAISIAINLAEDQKAFHSLNFQSNDLILHLAGIVGKKKIENDVHFAKKINVEGTLKLARAAIERDISKFVFISSAHVYKSSDENISEMHEITESSHYSSQKIETEYLLREEFINCPEKLLIVRLFSILDLGTPEESLGGAIRKVKMGSRKDKIMNPQHIRDFLTSQQAAAALESMTSNSNMYGLINLCTGKGTSIRDATLNILGLENENDHNDLFDFSDSSKSRVVGDNNRLITIDPTLRLRWQHSNC